MCGRSSRSKDFDRARRCRSAISNNYSETRMLLDLRSSLVEIAKAVEVAGERKRRKSCVVLTLNRSYFSLYILARFREDHILCVLLPTTCNESGHIFCVLLALFRCKERLVEL